MGVYTDSDPGHDGSFYSFVLSSPLLLLGRVSSRFSLLIRMPSMRTCASPNNGGEKKTRNIAADRQDKSD